MSKIQSTGLGNPPELERAITRASLLDYGEALIIPAESELHVGQIRQLFFRMRRRAVREALRDPSIDPSEADPWRGLGTELVYNAEGQFGLQISRALKIASVTIIRADGRREQEQI